MIRGLSVVVVTLAFVLLDETTALAGGKTPLAFALAGILLLVNFLGYAELATSSPRPGGSYAQVQSTKGGWLAFLTGWMLILGSLAVSAMLAQGFGAQVTTLLRDHLDLTLPVWPWAAGLVLLLVVNNLLGTQTGPRRLTSLLLAVVLLLIGTLMAIPRIDLGYFQAPAPSWNRALPLVLAAFLGLETTTSLQGEMQRRQTHALRTMLLTPTLAIGIGALIFVVAIGVVGPQVLAQSSVPLALFGSRWLGGIGRPVVLITGALALGLSLNSVLRLAIRQIYIMSKDGYWPSILRQMHPRLGTPTWIIGIVGLLTLPLVFVPTTALAHIAGLIYLLVLMSVNLVLIRRPKSADSRLSLPFHPWIPALTLAIDLLLLLRLWGMAYLAVGIGTMGLGSLLYLTYARRHLIQAQEGVTIFKPPTTERGEPGRHRVLVPIANPATAGTLLRLAGTLARQQDGEVLALQVIVVPDQVPLEEGRRRAEASRVLLERAITQAQEEQFEIQTMTRVAHSVAQGILDTAREEEIDLILLGWRGYTRSFGASMGPVIDAVIRDAPCDVTVAKGDAWREAKKILVPTAGGPHAPIAARLAMLLSLAYGSEVTALHVQLGRATPEQMEENQRRIADTLNGLEFRTPPEQKVIVAESVVEGIVREAEGYDLVLLGASEEGLFDQFVFGTIPQQIAARVSKTAVIVRRYTGPTQLWIRKMTHSLSQLFPRLNVEEQLELREQMSSSAKPGVNYFVLIVLSSIIATLGLLLDSAAVVIGAMLVAPLMSPILAFSLGMVLSDVRLIRLSVEAVFKGVALALLVAIFLGVFSPFKQLTSEVLARTQPNLLDLGVALASGMAGAYALARKDVSAALPGVAIAAALMPPLSVAGLGLSLGEAYIAGGAFLLFLTNIASISLAGVIVFLLLGVRPQTWHPEARRQIRRSLLGFAVLVLVIAIPLGVIMSGIVQDTALRQEIQLVLEERARFEEAVLVDFEYRTDEENLVVVARIRSVETLDQAMVDTTADALSEHLNRPVTLEIITSPLIRSTGTP
jgi:uncharacterized hydrophobic protein (TIGR00271 family)